MFGLGGLGGLGMPMQPVNVTDTSETVYVSTLALLKMLKHGRAGVPVEVMGLLLGKIVDDYTIIVTDVFAMPQNGTGVSVEAVDAVFQVEMMELLKRTGRTEESVGWYHSHPGFGCWFSTIDLNQQINIEKTGARQIGIVVDPIQSMKGKIVIDCFRTNGSGGSAMGDFRSQTSNVGSLRKPTGKAVATGLGRTYYSLPIQITRTAVDENLLSNLQKKTWNESLKPEMVERREENVSSIEKMIKLVKNYHEDVRNEAMDPKVRMLQGVGKVDSKKHLKIEADNVLSKNGVEMLGLYVDSIIF